MPVSNGRAHVFWQHPQSSNRSSLRTNDPFIFLDSVLEKIRHILNKRAIRQGGLVLVDQGFLSVATFVTGVLVARGNLQAEYGLYVLGWSLLSIFQSISNSLLGGSLTLRLPNINPEDRPAYQGSVLAHALVLCLLALLGILGVTIWSRFFSAEGGSTIRTLLPLVVIAIAPIIFRQLLRTMLLANLNVRAGVIPNIIGSVVQITACILLWYADKLSVGTAYLVIGLSHALAAAVMVLSQKGNYRFLPDRIWTDFRDGWGVGRHFAVQLLLYIFVSQVYPWLLLAMLDAKAVAIFGACQTIATITAPIVAGMMSYVFPRMTHGFKEDGEKRLLLLMWKSSGAIFIFLGLWTLAGGIYSENLLGIIFSDKYVGYGWLVVFLLIKNLIETTTAPMTNALQIVGRADAATIIYLLSSAVTIVAAPLAVLEFGVYGAGIASILAAIATSVARSYTLKRVMHRRGYS